jgi:hypothetical protein
MAEITTKSSIIARTKFGLVTYAFKIRDRFYKIIAAKEIP